MPHGLEMFDKAYKPLLVVRLVDRDFAFSLAKVVLTIAWADDTLQKEEKRALDNLLRKLPVLEEQDLVMLRLYMEYPITEEELEAIIHDFRKHCKSSEDRAFALKTLKNMLEADGEADERERDLYARIETELNQSDGIFSKFKNIFSSSNTPALQGRERQLDAYMENPIFFLLKKHAIDIDIQEIGNIEELEQLTLFGASVAAVVQADDDVSPNS